MRAVNHANRFSPSIRTKTCGASQIANRNARAPVTPGPRPRPSGLPHTSEKRQHDHALPAARLRQLLQGQITAVASQSPISNHCGLVAPRLDARAGISGDESNRKSADGRTRRRSVSRGIQCHSSALRRRNQIPSTRSLRSGQKPTNGFPSSSIVMSRQLPCVARSWSTRSDAPRRR
jgi:hypothetical protein